MKTQIKMIAGKEYPFILCPRCGIWIHEPDYESHQDSPECDRFLKNKPIRERATKRVLGKINRLGR